MSETEVNIPLLRKAVEWAEAEAAKPPAISQWLQAMWETHPDDSGYRRSIRSAHGRGTECGTTYCIAGYICHIQGIGLENGWAEDAAAALGITWSETESGDADLLFHASNTIEDVRRIAEEIAGERL